MIHSFSTLLEGISQNVFTPICPCYHKNTLEFYVLSSSSESRKLLEFDSREIILCMSREVWYREVGSRLGRFSRRVDFDLPNVGVPAILMVADDCNLEKKSLKNTVFRILDGDYHPTVGLMEFNSFNFLDVIVARTCSYWQSENTKWLSLISA